MRSTATRRRDLAVGASLLALLVCTTPAFAQDAADPATAQADGSEPEGDAIVVTGSRIARPELDAAVPVAVVGREQISQEGATNVQDILSELPQVGIGTTRTNSNFLTAANGVATIDLRNLGENRTLVLVNGRRYVAGLAGNSAVDVNNIPTDFLERVEVTTGGGSAVYGSDAVAGVVNFILRDSFEGVQVRGQAGITERGDNARQAFSVTAGTKFGGDDQGNVLLNFSYDRDEGLLSRKRSISDQDCFLNPTPEGPDGCGPAFYSSFAAQGRFEFLDANGGVFADPADQSVFTFNQTNQLVNGFPVGSGFNRNAVRRISTPVERFLVSGIANFDISENVELFAEGTYAKVKSQSDIEATPLGNADIYDGSVMQGAGIPITNPFIPTSVLATIAARNSDADPTNDVTALGFRRRQNEVFSRSNTADRDTYRGVVGVRGDLTDRFKFEASYTYGKLKDFTASQDIDNARYRNALDAEIGPDGQPRCRSAAARADGCVPINLFGFGTASPAAAAYVQAVVPKSEKITNEQQVVSGSISGSIPLFEAGPLGLAFGSEYRKEKSFDDLDILTNTGGNSGNQIPDTRGQFDVWEVFGEVDVPLLADRPFFHDLRILGAARYSDYSTVGGVFSWNAGAEWAPVPDLRLRGVYAVANRAPNIGELFSAPSETFPTGISDPCEGITATTAGAVAEACRAIPGVNAVIAANGEFNYELADVQGINGFDGGNINLKEEEAKTLTLGGVFTPRFIPGLSLTVDYFDIKIKDAINSVPRETTLLQCLLTDDPVFCNNVIRFANTGRVQTINAQLINVADIKTRGIDANLTYRTNPGWFDDDRLDFNLLYTHLLKLEQVSFPGGVVEENVGQLDGAGRLGAGFKDKASARLTYGAGGTSFSWQVNYLGKIRDTLGDPFFDPEDPNNPDNAALNALNRVGDRFYHDIQLRQRVGDFAGGSQFEFFVGVDNLFDKDPPFLPSGFASSITGAETAADTYDPFGRRFYAGAQFRF